MKNIAHRVVSRLLAGEELCRNEKFLRLSSQFGDSVFITGLIITTLPLGLLRRPVGWLIAQYHRWIVRRVLNIVDPIVAKRMTEAREAKNVPRYDDSIEWAIRLNDSQERDSRTISLEMLHILQAAAGAPGATLTHMIYQLLVEPKYIPLLADEMKAAMNSSENLNEVLSRLPLMDSFIMETNRMYPVGGGMS
jgi:cytochrome P450